MADDQINRLLIKIENRELVLPEFQREFTWNKKQAKELIESFLEDYPTGALLLWKTKEKIALKNMPDYNPDGRFEVLLDGQQRLTTLYLLIKDSIPPYYTKRDIGEGKDVRNLYYNLKTRELEYYIKKKMENNPLWVKVTDCFKGDKVDPFDIVAKIEKDENKNTQDLTKSLFKSINKLKTIAKEKYPIIYVKDSSTLREALIVFDRVNSAGTPLSQADIALAHMCSRWAETRRVFKKKIKDLKNKGFDFDLTFFVRAMNAVINHRAEYAQLHENTEGELIEGWEKLKNILDYLINVLKGRAFIYSTNDLNTNNVLIPIIGYLSLYGPEFENDSILKKMLYWMYAALYKRRYSGSVDQKLEEDLKSIKQEESKRTLPIDDLIAILKENEGNPKITKNNLISRGVGHPLYNMTNIVIRFRGGVDWSNNMSLEQPYGKKYKIERHHIFPKSILKKKGYDTNILHYRSMVHEIANRVPLTKSSNMEIFDQKPKDYLPKVKRENPGNIKKFFIPENEELWKIENYKEFLQKRRELIAKGINEYMEQLIDRYKIEEEKSTKIIKKGETKHIEFKQSLRWNERANMYDDKLEKPILKTICAFLNTKGGTLLIGVKDDGDIYGIQKDTDRFGSQDNYQLHLSNLISSRIGNNCMPYIDIRFEDIEGKKICRIDVNNSPRPTYLKENKAEQFYVRLGNYSKNLALSEANEYIEEHWD
ncbi:DUF262 domain-containing protein [Candidatus Woesearchaeota archaeon]|nr:DUF262 domain-containing protein [Candidatus Woesearchaeota archaeon]